VTVVTSFCRALGAVLDDANETIDVVCRKVSEACALFDNDDVTLSIWFGVAREHTSLVVVEEVRRTSNKSRMMYNALTTVLVVVVVAAVQSMG
jgi:hypothetical protein